MKTEVATKHKYDCNMAFGKKDPSCPRCQELLNGAEPRKSWHAKYYADQERRMQGIRSHDCVKSNCGPVCTAFDW